MKRIILVISLFCGLFFSSLTSTAAHEKYVRRDLKYVPTKENIEARKAFQNDKFGIFLHWGIYSMTAQGEWYMNVRNIDWKEYEKLASGFYPSKFDAKKWVSDIKASGAKYICITSRHHDGFSMFDTDYSDFNIVDATPFKRDILQELSQECKKQGIALHVYYSHLDWRREDYPIGRTGHHTGRNLSKANWDSYYDFMNNQLKEILVKYQPRALWFDGVWDHDSDKEPFDWHLEEQYEMIHEVSPACLIGNNHHETPFAGEDFQMFERDLPGQNSAGLSGQDISPLPLETCQTMNGMWGYKIEDQNYKSADTIIKYIVNAAGRNANLLLNLGPQPNGELPEKGVEKLKEVGEWMKKYGETIYGTRGGIIAPHSWGVSTQKGDKLYIHILDLQDKCLYLPLFSKIKKVKDLTDTNPVKYSQDKDGTILKFEKIPSEVDYIIEISLK